MGEIRGGREGSRGGGDMSGGEIFSNRYSGGNIGGIRFGGGGISNKPEDNHLCED